MSFKWVILIFSKKGFSGIFFFLRRGRIVERSIRVHYKIA